MTHSNPPDPWPKLKARIEEAANTELKGRKDGIVVLHLELWADGAGDPIFWFVRDVSRLEPTSSPLYKAINRAKGEMWGT